MELTQQNGNINLNYLTFENLKERFGEDALKGLTYGIRADLNSPLDEKSKIIDESRIAAAMDTIDFFSDYGPVVVLAHQGRTGKKDCIPLEQHAEIMRSEFEKRHKKKVVLYHKGGLFDHVTNRVIRELMYGQVFLLDNMRFLSEEHIKDATPYTYNRTNLIRSLESLINVYVNNAFSVSHRNDASITGFINTLNIAGLLMQQEIKENKETVKSVKSPFYLVLGGLKADEYFDLMVKTLKESNENKVLATGGLAMLGLIGEGEKGYNLGEPTYNLLIKEQLYNLRHKIRGLIQQYNLKEERIVLPKDFVVEDNGEIKVLTLEQLSKLENRNAAIADIGPETLKKYTALIKKAKTAYNKGPAGKYEDERFREGTKGIDRAMIESEAFTIISGGDTIASVKICGFEPEQFDRHSLSGNAFIQYFEGNQILPGLLALHLSYNAFNGINLKENLPENFNPGFKLYEPAVTLKR